MPRHWTKLRLGWRWVVGIVLATILCGFCTVARANSAAPPTLTWFQFDYAGPVQPLEGVQVVQCSDRDCQFRVLLAETGDCRGEHCLAFPAPKTRRAAFRPPFNCRENSFGRRGQRCLSVSGYFQDNSLLGGTEFFKLVAQFPEQHLESDVMDVAQTGWHNQTWQVTAQTNGLEMAQPKRTWFTRHFTGFEIGFGLTVVSEVLVVWGYGRWRKLAPAGLRRLLATLGFVHLMSYLVVWNFITGFDYFQLPGTRAFSVVCFAIAIAWSKVLWSLRNKDLKVLIPVGLVTLPPLFFVGLIVTLFVGYGQQVPVADGLPRWLTVAIAETFAVVYEAVLLRWLNPKALSWLQAGGLSLVANGVSVLLGAIVWLGAVRWLM